MKETLIASNNQRLASSLTTNLSSPRLSRGVNFMAEGESSASSNQRLASSLDRENTSKVAERIPSRWTFEQKDRVIPQERIDKAREAWRQNYLRRGVDISNPKNALPADERSTVELLIQEGRPPISGGAEPVSSADFPDPVLRDIVEEINSEINNVRGRTPPGQEPILDEDFISDQLRRVRDLRDRGAVNRDQAGRLLNSLNQWRREERQERQKQYQAREAREQRRPEGLWQALHEEDFELLRSDEKDAEGRYVKLDEFVNKWFDTLYAAAGSRDPSQSPAFEGVQRADQEASIFLSIGRTVEERKKNSEKLAYVSDLFETRIRNLTMNWGAISSKSIESIQKGSFGLRAHGLLAGATLDKGYTGEMFNRITELLEDERLKSKRGHLTPELTNSIQEKVIEEAISLRGNFRLEGEREVYEGGGIGTHAGKGRKDIERAVRSAYDMVVNSQRMHIIAARGRELFGADAFFSDAGAAFKAFNPKTFVSEKWGILNITDQRFLREVMEKSLIDEWLEDKRKTYKDLELNEEQRRDLGDILFKTMDSPPDFFSSGWRIKGMRDLLQQYFEYREFFAEARRRDTNPDNFTTAEWNTFKSRFSNEEKKEINARAKSHAEKFGLFIRLKTASTEEGGRDRAEKWKAIRTYRPEEIIRLLREKYTPEEMARVNRAIFGTGGYDEFKKEFGAVLRAIREQGFRGTFSANNLPEQINFADMPNQIRVLLGDQAERVQEVYSNMQSFISNNNIAYIDTGQIDSAGKPILTTKNTVFDKDYRFADLYDKTLVTDDILLGTLEVLNENQRNFGMLELSKTWSSDLGGDAYVRNMNDLAAGHAYTDELIGFLKETNEEEKFKHAEAAALKAADYNGRGGQAKALRHTIIPFMWASMPPGFFDTLGVEKLPLRMKMTLIEDIYGYHAKPLTQDQRREALDKIEAKLKAAIQNELDELKYKLEENTRKLQSGDYENEEERERLEREVEEYPHKVKEAREKGERYKHSAEKLLNVRGRDIFKQKLIGVLIFILIGAAGEVPKVIDIGGKR